MTRPLIATDSTRERRPRASMFGGWPSRRSTTPTTSTPAASRSAAAARPRSSAVSDERALGRLDRPEVDEAPRAVGEHHADEVVAGEDERLLDDAGRDDDPVQARILTSVSPCATGTKPYSKSPIAIAGARSSTPASQRRLPELGRARVACPVGEQRAADGGALVHEDHAVAARRGRRSPPRAPPDRRRSRGRRRARGRPRPARCARRSGRASRARPRRGGPSRTAARASAAG